MQNSQREIGENSIPFAILVLTAVLTLNLHPALHFMLVCILSVWIAMLFCIFVLSEE